MMLTVWIAGIGVLITFSTFLATAIWKGGFVSGELKARVTALETWRGNIRFDMHEVSDKLEMLVSEMKALHTLIEERTERRSECRAADCPRRPFEASGG